MQSRLCVPERRFHLPKILLDFATTLSPTLKPPPIRQPDIIPAAEPDQGIGIVRVALRRVQAVDRGIDRVAAALHIVAAEWGAAAHLDPCLHPFARGHHVLGGAGDALVHDRAALRLARVHLRRGAGCGGALRAVA